MVSDDSRYSSVIATVLVVVMVTLIARVLTVGCNSAQLARWLWRLHVIAVAIATLLLLKPLAATARNSRGGYGGYMSLLLLLLRCYYSNRWLQQRATRAVAMAVTCLCCCYCYVAITQTVGCNSTQLARWLWRLHVFAVAIATLLLLKPLLQQCATRTGASCSSGTATTAWIPA